MTTVKGKNSYNVRSVPIDETLSTQWTFPGLAVFCFHHLLSLQLFHCRPHLEELKKRNGIMPGERMRKAKYEVVRINWGLTAPSVRPQHYDQFSTCLQVFFVW
jgi:hypothetical protein